MALDPQSVEAKGWLALTLADRVLGGMTNTRGADIARAKELVDQVMATFPAARLRISPKANSCALKGGGRRPVLNTRC